MTSPRRVGAETSETRSVLLDRTERLMVDQGYAAVTYRRVASAAGVTAPLVQYYFPTLDDLFLALLRRRSDKNLQKLTEALASHPDTPLRIIWEHSADETSAALMIELMALGNHRKTIRAEIAQVSERARKVQLDALSATRKPLGLAGADVPNSAVLFLMTGIPKIMLMESSLGFATGHAETLDIVKQYLNLTESAQRKRQPEKPATKSATARKANSISAPGRARKSAQGRKASGKKSAKSPPKTT
jgi:TetR/AcrR family transcriptional regulator, transcriptional repressor for nem operon